MSTSWSPKIVHRVLLEAIRLGWVKQVIRPDGQPGYQLTELGEKHMGDLLDESEEE